MYTVMATKNDIIVVEKTTVSYHKKLGFKPFGDFRSYVSAMDFAKSLEMSRKGE